MLRLLLHPITLCEPWTPLRGRKVEGIAVAVRRIVRSSTKKESFSSKKNEERKQQ